MKRFISIFVIVAMFLGTSAAVICEFMALNDSTIDIPVKVVWEDNNNERGARPDGTHILLFVVGVCIVEVDGSPPAVDSTNNWAYTFKGLPKDAEYEVLGTDFSPYYNQTTSGNATEGFTIIYSSNSGKMDLQVKMEWNDEKNIDGIRPDSIDVELYEYGKAEGTGKIGTLTASNNWTYTFKNLDKFKEERISYELKQLNLPDTYEETYNWHTDADDTKEIKTIVNTQKNKSPEAVRSKATVQMEWNDNNGQDVPKPDSMRVRLLVNGQDIGQTFTLDESNSWSMEIEALPKYLSDQEPVYTFVPVDSSEDYTISTVHNGNTTTMVTTYSPKRPSDVSSHSSSSTTSSQTESEHILTSAPLPADGDTSRTTTPPTSDRLNTLILFTLAFFSIGSLLGGVILVRKNSREKQ